MKRLLYAVLCGIGIVFVGIPATVYFLIKGGPE